MNGASLSRLDTLFRPSSIVLVGASETSYWTHGVHRNLVHYGFEGEIHAVNRSGKPVFGVPGYVSCTAIGKPVDVAYISVAAAALPDAFQDVIDAGIKGAVILTSGMAEVGEEGAALQRRIVEMADANGVAMFGPNSLGFVNVRAKAPVSGLGLIDGLRPGGVAVLTQSGALASELLFAAARQDVGLSFYSSTGNEAMIGLADIVDYLVDDADTKVIAVCAEAIRKPERLAQAGRRALAAGKPIVILKIGAGELAAQVARAHTGSLVGDDGAFSAACDAYGLIRVQSIEQLLATAALFDSPDPWTGEGVAFVSISGGACTLFADAAERARVPMPSFSPQTVHDLQAILPKFATIMNPLDITGGAVSNPAVFTQAIEIVGRDPNVGRVFSQIDIHDTNSTSKLFPLHSAVGEGLRACDPPGIHLVTMARDIAPEMSRYLREVGIPKLTTGIEQTVGALGGVFAWTRRRARPLQPEPSAGRASARPTSELETLEYLRTAGVSVAPTTLVRTADEAAAAARRIDGHVVLKIASPDIAHKTEVGGVMLDLSAESVGQSFERMMAAVRQAAPDARLDGAIVAPMRSGGLELIVGVTRDADWGPLLLVGIGGVMVEALQDTVVRLAPVSPEGVREMLESLRGAKLFKGFRGSAAVDLETLSKQISAICEAALALGPELEAFEVNPLLVNGERIEALDGLAVWRDAPLAAQ